MPIGKKPLPIKEGVQVEVGVGKVMVRGPLGELTVPLPAEVKAEVKDQTVSVSRGTEYALIRNAILGVSEGFTRELELVGVGYRAQTSDAGLKLNLGFSHPVEFKLPPGVAAEVEGNTKIKLQGVDKQSVSQTAAHIRQLRPPEPYKGRGIKYAQEVIRRKLGKAGKALAGATLGSAGGAGAGGGRAT